MTGRRAFVAAVAALALSLAACSGGSGGDQPSDGASSGATSGSGATGAAAAKRALCNDILLIQSGFRPDALERFLVRLKADRQAFAAAGDTATAKQVAVVAAATTRLRQALLDQKGVQQASQALGNALAKLPTC
ncbi:MAG TPA: hypothetical protein VNN79_21850 [Actinomycetota bacterium]|nr:hypothetical protein [Actinomycetota bacterium]